MATSLGDFLPYVLPQVPGCPDIAAKAEILRAAIRFCEETRTWKVLMSGVNVVAGTASYAIPVPSGAVLVLVEQAYVDGREITPQTVDVLKERYSNWLVVEGWPQWFTQLEPDRMTLVPKPTADYAAGLVVRGCYKPSRAASTVPDFLFERYAEVIGHGAAALLLATPGKAWTDAKAAAVQDALYQAGRDQARQEAGKAFGRARNRVRIHSF